MACRRVELPGGGFAIVCGRGQTKTCSRCGAAAGRGVLCDWKLAGAKAGKTCDRFMCLGCAVKVGEDKHLCEPHGKLWDKHPANPRNKASH